MPRFYTPIPLQQLVDKIEQINDSEGYSHNIRKFTPQVEKDFKKVNVDIENVYDYPSSSNRPIKKIIGYCLIDDFAFYGFYCGGDWENPVFHIIYWDGKKLRGYIPDDGNPWNRKTKYAYGNAAYNSPDAEADEAGMDETFDVDKIIADIKERIKRK